MPLLVGGFISSRVESYILCLLVNIVGQSAFVLAECVGKSFGGEPSVLVAGLISTSGESFGLSAIVNIVF